MLDKVLLNDHNYPLKVLFVDDEAVQCQIYESIFVGRCEIEVARSASEAKEILAAKPGEIAVIVSDICMPTESGIELLKYVKENYPSVVRILASAYATSDIHAAISAINECAVHKYLQKPLQIEPLRKEIKEAFEMYLHATLDTHLAQHPGTLYDEFKSACDRWTLHNVDLSQELRALDYGLCGIISVFREKVTNTLLRDAAEEVLNKMDEYVENILCSSMLYSHTDTKGEFYLNRSSDLKH